MHKNVASIQFLRFIAATSVVLCHAIIGFNSHLPGAISSLLKYLTGFGASGVHIFFVISGFIMVYTSFARDQSTFSTSHFVRRRLTRIYPIYFIYAACYLIFYHFVADGYHLSTGQLVGAFLLLPSYSQDIIGPGWTLAYEVYFYACFSVAMAFGLTRGLVSLTVFFLTSILLRVIFHFQHPVMHVLTSTLLAEFLMGAWIGYVVVSRRQVGGKFANCMIVFAFIGFLAGLAFGYREIPSVITWGIPSALLIAGVVFNEINGNLPSAIRRLSFFGESSYSLYLMHVLLIDIVIFLAMHYDSALWSHVRFLGDFGMTAVCMLFAAYCIVIAWVSYELIEKRIVSSLNAIHWRKVTPAAEMIRPR